MSLPGYIDASSLYTVTQWIVITVTRARSHVQAAFRVSSTGMRPTQTPHRTPLRRISQGSLFRLSRSGAYPNAPHGLGFLEPALSEFLDETEALQTNVEGLKNLSNSLATFNESFASWLYIMNMNALTTDWPQVRGGFNTDR
jgi:DASH complex subunit Dam1